MAIVNAKGTADFIAAWIKNYFAKNGLKTAILGLSGGIDSALVALLLKRANLPILCVNMPCHSSSSAFTRAAAFAADFGLPLVKVDLSPAHDAIYGQAMTQGKPDASLSHLNLENRVAVGGLRSGLRAPLLAYYANTSRGLVVGTGNRSEDNLTRYFQKVGDGCVDISPIADLFKGEVRELFAYLASAEGTQAIPASAQAILDAKPTADLWGPDQGQEDEKELGMSYEDVEWADRENMRTAITRDATFGTSGIVESEEDPAKHPAWLGYTGHQRMVIAKIHAMEKATRHKYNPALPVCRVREEEGLVR
jgi:NAD+ synthase